MSASASPRTRAPRGHPTTAALQEQIRQRDDTLELLTESIAELELALDAQGWERILTGSVEGEFSRDALIKIMQLARLMNLKNALVKRGLAAQRHYVWGQGITVQAKDATINAVVQAFMDDVKNQVELTGDLAMGQRDTELATDGNLFLVLFVTPATGRVRLRSVSLREVVDVVTNPDDAKEPWYYKRTWTETRTNLETGHTETTERNAYYPDWQYRPIARPGSIGSVPVVWDSPVCHIKVGGYSDWKFGLSEVYAAIDWGRAYTSFLEDWATITRAYSRFAWKLSTQGGKQGVAAAKTRLGTTRTGGNPETNPPATAGSTFIASEGVAMDPIRTAGATTKMEDGRRILLMVAAAMNLPETFFGDVSVGTLATATSLDRPTELAMKTRQTLWAGILEALLLFVVTWAVRAPNGPLRGLGAVKRDPATGTETVAWGPDVDPHVDVDFPPIVSTTTTERVASIVAAAPKLPDGKLIARLLLDALGVDDQDTILADMFNDDGTPKRPPVVPAVIAQNDKQNGQIQEA
jgi:hypothetical protein